MRATQYRYYRFPTAAGWKGFVEPENRRWVAFLGHDGHLAIFKRRDPITGAVPLELPPP